MSEMVERVARAIAQAEGVEASYCRDGEYHEAARAAIEAMRSMNLVYREDGNMVHEMRGAPDDIWKTILTAALS